jgi:hypothetical protein
MCPARPAAIVALTGIMRNIAAAITAVVVERLTEVMLQEYLC